MNWSVPLSLIIETQNIKKKLNGTSCSLTKLFLKVTINQKVTNCTSSTSHQERCHHDVMNIRGFDMIIVVKNKPYDIWPFLSSSYHQKQKREKHSSRILAEDWDSFLFKRNRKRFQGRQFNWYTSEKIQWNPLPVLKKENEKKVILLTTYIPVLPRA